MKIEVITLEEAAYDILHRVFEEETVVRLMTEPQSLFGGRTGKQFIEEDGPQALINWAVAIYEGGLAS